MKLNVCCLLVAAVAATLVVGCASEGNEHESEGGEHHHADLKAEAKISEADARTIALTKVPDGTIKEAELEKEKGKLIWSFDIAKPNAEGIGEINVDAMTGEIVGVEK